MLNIRTRIYKAFASIAIAGIALSANALPNANSTGHRGTAPTGTGLRGTAALCDQASASVDIDINNVRARLMNGGDMWYDRGTSTAKYEVPKGSGKNSLFAGSIWVGGYDEQNNLKVCAQTYRQTGNDYWPGPLDLQNATIDKATCTEWDKIWKVNKSDILAFNALLKAGVTPDDPIYNDIKQWPAAGNGDAVGRSGAFPSVVGTYLDTRSGINTYAPFIDVDGDGKYNWRNGDYPDIFGDQYAWWVFNDAGGVKTETQTGTIGMEIQTSTFAYATKDYMNDATFINYRLINRGTLNLTKTYMATWTDADLGYAFDDYIGCDTQRSLGILYNATTPDGFGDQASYGSQVPMVGVDFFIGPKKDTFINGVYQVLDTLGMAVFNYFNNSATGPLGNPNNGTEIYRLITGFNRQGDPMHDDRAQGPNSTAYGPGVETKFAFPGNPNNPSEWSQCQCHIPYGANPDGDRRFIHSSGPFTLYSGGIVNDVTIGAVWVSDVGGCGTATFTRIRAADDLAQELFESGFRTLEKPNAPDMTVREGDRELIVYLTNENEASNNYHEKYGRDTAKKYRESSVKARRYGYSDSLYKFEGYRVFQLKNSQISAAQIFGDDGQVDASVAAEVFQADIANGVSNILNYTRNPDKGPDVYDAAVKVKGKDSGLIHSFRVTEDKFATGSDKRLVNYKTYYFIAIAYAYNNFRVFQYGDQADSTQNEAYIDSKSAAGGKPVPVVAAVPNPTNGNMGTTVGAGFGDGVEIQMLEGLGNGRNAISMIPSSEEDAMKDPNYTALQPTYAAGNAPVDVKILDPRKLQDLDYEIWLTGQTYTDQTKGIIDSLGTWTLKDKAGNVLYSESNLANKNDAILANYGLTITVQQGRRPGDNQVDRNGYITSSVTFSDPSKLWLAGINDVDGPTARNWIRSGGSPNDPRDTTANGCSVKNNNRDTAGQFYETLFSNNDLLKGSWAPYAQASQENNAKCGFGVARTNSQPLSGLESVDIVFTSDKSKWTRCGVIELNDDVNLAEGRTAKFRLRRHAGWNLDVDGNGRPVYSGNVEDSGMSWFPGYAISQSTGRRLNVIFGEDSYLKNQHGNDMIWNPTSDDVDGNNNVFFGGKHYIYVMNTTYDRGQTFVDLNRNGTVTALNTAYNTMMWVGLPRLTPGFNLLSIDDGLIPTETRLKIRVEGPYRSQGSTANTRNNGLPIFGFTTKNIAPKPLTDAGNPYYDDKQALLDKIRVVPNPYYAYSGYERARLDTRVKVTNLPNRATISIYALDGTLIRKLEHANTSDNTQGFEDWDLRNTKGLQIASGMYLIHVKAEGVGETVIKWFGAMRPTDVVNY